MWDLIKDAFLDAGKDSLSLVLFLFITYVVMEIFERYAGRKSYMAISKAGRFGPVFGSLLGVVPQCGFSTVASNLFAGRMITIGTLFAVYLSTSDEMLPILLSSDIEGGEIVHILLTKVIIALIWGILLDIVFEKKKPHLGVPDEEELAEKHGCACCRPNVLITALFHTLKVIFFIFLFSFVMNLLILMIGEDTLATFFANTTVAGIFASALLGLVPNCASSVVITELYLDGMFSVGALMSGLLVNAGVGLLVLFNENKSLRENLTILAILYGIGVISGSVIMLMGLAF